jgi:beta-phosphoglucomutase-like phosphatase (HAD superfamily)
MAEQVAFLFDMDGTIADTMPFHIQAWMSLLGELGVQMGPEEFLRKTSGNRAFTLDGLGITAYFDAVVGAEDVQSGKPSPEIFLRAAERVGAAPSSCVVFEDALSGVEAAARAGMKAVAMATSLTAREFQGHPAVIRIAADYTSLRPQDLLQMARPPKPA